MTIQLTAFAGLLKSELTETPDKTPPRELRFPVIEMPARAYKRGEQFDLPIPAFELIFEYSHDVMRDNRSVSVYALKLDNICPNQLQSV